MRSAILAYVVLVLALLLVPCLHRENCVGKALSHEKAAHTLGAVCYSFTGGSGFVCYSGAHCTAGMNSGYTNAKFIQTDPKGKTTTTSPCPCGGNGTGFIAALTATNCYPN